jgi:hypothetical protein
MSLFDNENLPILAAFAVAAPELFAAEAVGGEAVVAGSAEAAAAEATAQEVARQEAARIAAEEAAKEAARQEAARQAAMQGSGQGIMQAGVMTPQQAAYMDASTAGINAVPGTTPLPATTPAPAGIPQGLQTNTGFGASVEPININAPGMGTPVQTATVDGVVQPAAQPSAFDRGFDKFSAFAKQSPYITAGAGYVGAYNLGLLDPRTANFNNEPYDGALSKYRMSPGFQGRTANPQDYQYTPRYAGGGIMSAAGGGPVEQMSNADSIGANTGYPQAGISGHAYSVPYQSPVGQNVVTGTADTGVNSMTGEQNFASGGIAHFARGNLARSTEHYMNMMEGDAGKQIARMQTPAAGSSDVGIIRDTDPDTMYLDPLSAAQVRMAKVNKRANIQGMGMKRPTPMGQINLRPPGTKAEAGGSSLDPENAAQGGIMQASGHLGGYAAGGQPRLLKGPGDGMSDNIPATIAGKQPARLADGEFVVPADVVSHLGNGSTAAGAKKLHQMMTNVRKARTGNPKQGKQINPNKFTPK